jgi:hypothetical protein
MTTIAPPERVTQNKVIGHLTQNLKWDYLGDWQYGRDNSNVEQDILIPYLQKQYTIPSPK